MGLLAEYEIATDDLALGPTVAALPDAGIAVASVHALEADLTIGFYWIECDDRERLESALERDETVGSFERAASTDAAALYRIESRDPTTDDAYREWVGLGGQLLDCHVATGRWRVSMRFPDRERFGEFHAFLADRGVEFELHRLSEGATPERDGEDPLTRRQREALELAYERGFFDVPRRTTLSELADELGISDQAVSERLRRGQTSLLEEFVR